MSTLDRAQHSLKNVIWFASRVPSAFARRREGQRYLTNHPEMARSYSTPDAKKIAASIQDIAGSVDITEIQLDETKFREWVQQARYPLLAYHAASEEKYLEHFLSVELLGDALSGTLLDVASWRSYFPVLMRHRGLRVIVQDLVYKPGLHGDLLGCNAAEMPLPDASIDAMTLHCSFEHFEGEADQGFVREAARILKPGGQAVIIPLYLHEQQLTWVDPYFLSRGERIAEEGATFQPSIGYNNRFGRMYSPQTFVDRVLKTARLAGLELKLVRVEGLERMPSCYLQFAAVLRKPH